MTLPQIRDLVDGKWLPPQVALGPIVDSPNDGTPLYPHVASDAFVVEDALAAAARAHADGRWRTLSVEKRAAALERVASELEARQAQLARVEAETTGVVLAFTRRTSAILPATFRNAAATLRAARDAELPGSFAPVEILHLPRGPAAVITPWNAPTPIAAHKVASALAAGCPVILKPSDLAPHGCGLLAEAIDAAGLPRAVFQLVHGAAVVGQQLVSDARIRAVSFTGGLTGGRAVAVACAQDLKPVQLELGGNNPLVVLDDADLDDAADGVVAALATLNGQWCRALGRLVVAASVEEPLLARVHERLTRLRLGDSRNPDSEMGPLVHRTQLARVAGAVDRLCRNGARALSSTPLPLARGCFYPPTLLFDVPPTEAVDEIFGPVATVHPFHDAAEALALANGTPFGLAGYVFSRDEARALAFAREIQAGMLKVNGVTLTGLHPAAPRPAWGWSGLHDEGTVETFELFRGTRVVGVAGRRPVGGERRPA